MIPAGGLSPDGTRWISCRKDFFLPVRVLSRVFRGKFIHGLKQAYANGRLSFHGRLEKLAEGREFERWVDRAVRQDWVVYAKRPFGGPQQVVRYLARYTHRVAISNRRLIEVSQGSVRFSWKDYADGGARKVMTLSAVEFLRRFLLHTLPRQFRRIRYYGFLANRQRSAQLARCRQLLAGVGLGCADPPLDVSNESPEGESPNADRETIRCPACGSGTLVKVELVAPATPQLLRGPHFLRLLWPTHSYWDTS